MNDRRRALELLRRIERERLFASLVLRDETPFVRTLVLGVLRWRSRLDFVAGSLARRRVDAELLDVLRLGIFQLLYADVAPHAAVSETVNLAPRHGRGFVNAVLRRVAEGRVTEPKDVATRTAHPEWLVARWTRTYGAERAAAIAAADQELSFPDVLSIEGPAPPGGVPSTLVDRMFRLAGSTSELDRREFWPMDEGSAVVASIAAAASDGEVLDLAAAPGSKTRYMETSGVRVVSNDVSLARLRPLYGRRLLVVGDGRMPPFRRAFETVLLDAPCSATGTIRKNPELKWRLDERDLAGFAALQKELLSAALRVTGRVCIYSTCSLEPEENDDVVRACGAVPIDVTSFVPEGARRWVENGVLRLTPESGTDGFTVFVLSK